MLYNLERFRGSGAFLLIVTLPVCSRVVAYTRSQTAPELFAQLAAPLYFVDFLREPVVDEETGETLDAHPSYYEAALGGLPEIRCFDASNSDRRSLFEPVPIGKVARQVLTAGYSSDMKPFLLVSLWFARGWPSSSVP